MSYFKASISTSDNRVEHMPKSLPTKKEWKYYLLFKVQKYFERSVNQHSIWRSKPLLAFALFLLMNLKAFI